MGCAILSRMCRIQTSRMFSQSMIKQYHLKDTVIYLRSIRMWLNFNAYIKKRNGGKFLMLLSFDRQYPKIGNLKQNGNSVFSIKDMHCRTSFDIFIVTYRVTNFLPKLINMLLFSTEKKLNLHVLISLFRVVPFRQHGKGTLRNPA